LSGAPEPIVTFGIQFAMATRGCAQSSSIRQLFGLPPTWVGHPSGDAQAFGWGAWLQGQVMTVLVLCE
jgi:hypothetical protein